MNTWLRLASDKCPHCDAAVPVSSPELFGDVQCPKCATRLLFLKSGRQASFLGYPEAERVRELLVNFIAEQLGVAKSDVRANASLVNDLGIDSLDALELVLAIDEELDAH